MNLYEVPALSDFRLSAEAEDLTVWMQCIRCLEVWEIVNLGEAVRHWNEHVCREQAT